MLAMQNSRRSRSCEDGGGFAKFTAGYLKCFDVRASVNVWLLGAAARATLLSQLVD